MKTDELEREWRELENKDIPNIPTQTLRVKDEERSGYVRGQRRRSRAYRHTLVELTSSPLRCNMTGKGCTENTKVKGSKTVTVSPKTSGIFR